MAQVVIEGFALSPQQKRLWAIQNGSPAYCVQCAILLEGRIKKVALKEALRRVVARHEILRTTFHSLPGMDIPVQAISDDPMLEYRETDLSELGGAQQDARVKELYEEQALRSFDLKMGPVARFFWARLSEERSVLLCQAPSICADGRSLKNLFYDITSAYAASFGGEDFSDEIVQYADFSAWQAAQLESDEARAGRQFWLDLGSAPNQSFRLPFEKPSAESLNSDLHSVETEMTVEALEKITNTAARYDIRMADFLLACWQTLLWRLNEKRNLTIGYLSSGRKYEPLETALGLYARFLPVHTCVEKDFRFSEVLKAVDRSLQEACAQEDYFLWDEPSPIDGAGQPFFSVGFEYEELAESEIVNGVRFSILRQRSLLEKLKLSLVCSSYRRGLTLRLRFDPARWRPEEASCLASYFSSLLDSAASDPDLPVGQLQLLSPALRRRILFDWNDSARQLSHPGPARLRLEAQALATADSIAICYGDQALSFLEFNQRANRVAWFLIGRGLGPESVVAVLMPRGLEQLICLWGIWKAGAAFLPVDASQPWLRLQAMFKEVRPAVALTDLQERAGPLAEMAQEAGAELYALEALGDQLRSLSDVNPEVKVDDRSLAYMIFTSGSTGEPKAVMIEQGAVANLLEALDEGVYEGGRGERVSVNAPVFFDGAIKQVIQSGMGRTLVIAPEEIRADGREMVEFVKREMVEALDCTPSQLQVMVEAGLLERRCGGLSKALVGGEAIAERLKEELKCEGVRFYNLYGPTECAVDATAGEISARDERVSIGRRLSNVRVYALDEEMCAVAPGLGGELFIAGAGVGRGYYGRADLTAERFGPNPYGESGERMYRTGDVCRYDVEGRLEYVRRVDRQVKLRGNRVELGEIERALEQHGWVKQAVMVVKGEEGDSRLVGYVVGRRGMEEGRGEEEGRYRLANGMRVEQQSREETEALYEEIFAKRMYERCGVRVPVGETVVMDVGANIGLFTLYVRERNPRARVIAIEPIGEVCEKLRRNVRGAGELVKVRQAGVGREEGREEFVYYERMSVMSGMRRYANESEEKEVVKRVLRNELEGGSREAEELLEHAEELLERRLESRVEECRVESLSAVMREEEVRRVGLLKVDVQGAELEVLRGIEEGDWEKIDQVVMEVHDRAVGEEGRVEEVRRMLERRGYRVEVEQGERMKGTGRYNVYGVREGVNYEIEEEEEERREEAEDVSEEELKRHLRERVPEYMIPAAIVKMERLPLTRNGKVDLERLERLEIEEEREEREEGVRTAYEEMLGVIWEEVLGVKVKGVEENFFERGGHSLLATRLVSRVRDEFGVELPLRKVFEKAVLSEMAREVEERRRGGEWEGSERIEAAAGEGRQALSFAQQRLWFLNQLRPGSSEYNSWRAIRVKGELKIEALRKALNEILRRHEVLRTKYPVVDGMPMQEIVANQEIVMEELDLRGVREEEREELAEEAAKQEGARGFDLVTGPLLMVKVIRTGEEERILVVTMHHIVSDAWSLGILVKELNALYDRYSRGEESQLEDLKVQYADYACWQRAWVEGESFQKQMQYWKRQLAGDLPTLRLQVDRVKTAKPANRAAQHRFKISQRLTDRLRSLTRKEGATMFMTLLAAFKALLHHYSGQDDMIVGAPIANRNRAEVENLIGFFVNILAMRTDLSGDPSFVDLLRRVREVALDAYAHQDVPFEKIVEALRPERSLHRSPLFQVTFTLQNAPLEALSLPGLALELLDFEADTMPYDFMLDMWEFPDGVGGAFRYDTGLLSPTTMTRLARRYESLLQTVAAQPDVRLKALTDLLAEADREDRLHEAQELKTSRLQKLRAAQRQAFEPLETD